MASESGWEAGRSLWTSECGCPGSRAGGVCPHWYSGAALLAPSARGFDPEPKATVWTRLMKTADPRADVRRVGRVRLADIDSDLVPPHAANGGSPVVPVIEIAANTGSDAVTSVARGTRSLILKGFLLRTIAAGGGSITEVLGPGDMIFDHNRHDEPLVTSVEWRVLERTLVADLATLDTSDQAIRAVLLESIARRLQEQVDRATVRCAVQSVIRVDVRLLAYLWHLAGSYGVITPAGVRLDLPLTHLLLAELIGARRPTVTTGFGVLTAGGFIRREGRSILLLGDCVSALDAVAAH